MSLQFTTAAIVEAASPNAPCNRELPTHRVSKLYYMVVSAHLLRAYQSVFGEVVVQIDGVERRGVAWPTWAITTRIDIKAYRQTVWEAILCHESQLAVYRQLEHLSQDYQKEIWESQTYYRAFSAGGIAASAAFVVSLYALLVGTKLGIAFLLSRSQGWLKGRTYHALLAGSGLLLIGLGVLLIWEGVQHFL